MRPKRSSNPAIMRHLYQHCANEDFSAKRILTKLCECGEVTVADVREALARGVKKTAEEIAFAINGKLPEIARALLRHMLTILNAQDHQLAQVEAIMEKARIPYNFQIQLLSTIPGIDILAATYIIAEIGVDMSRFTVNNERKKPASRISSWAGLSPKNDKSAGKVKSRKIKKGNNYVKLFWFNARGLPQNAAINAFPIGIGRMSANSVKKPQS